MKTHFGTLPSGTDTYLYTIRSGKLLARISDYGATLVQLLVPDNQGALADVVLGFDDCNGYRACSALLGATVGRNCNRIAGAKFKLGNKQYHLEANNGKNNLHGSTDHYGFRLWKVESHTESQIVLFLHSPHGDQGFPGNADIRVTYSLEKGDTLRIRYDAVSDRDTVFNLTNHSYFNLAGHQNPQRALDQTMIFPARVFCPTDSENITTGEERSVVGTPFDFREPKPIRRDIDADYETMKHQRGYDHTFEVFCDPAAILCDPVSGRTMAICTDCPGVHLYSGNFIDEQLGKGGVKYGPYAGMALETQFYPNSVNYPHWKQPFTPANTPYHSETTYTFK